MSCHSLSIARAPELLPPGAESRPVVAPSSGPRCALLWSLLQLGSLRWRQHLGG